jgi:cold-inducible RNA-binding protein
MMSDQANPSDMGDEEVVEEVPLPVEDNQQPASAPVSQAHNASQANPSKLYVGNLNYSVTDQDLVELFNQAGQVVSASVIQDKMSGRSKGFGFVEMATKEAADKAVEMLNGSTHMTRPLVVNVARPLEDRPPRRDFRDNDRPRRY